MTTGTEDHDNFDTARLTGKADYLNLQRVRMAPPHFCLKLRKVDESDSMTRSHTCQIEKRNV